MDDTIAAISTSLGVGAISIIRVSGTNAIEIVNELFHGKNLLEVPTHTIHYGHIKEQDKIIDEVLVSIMRAPKTFTTEDVVEINCHGGITTTNKILEILLSHGIRLAEPGEFTKRAFLNGRIDLVNAESVMDLIESKTEKVRKLAINGLDGKISKLVTALRQKILEILASIEVNIDYPEYEDIEVMTNEKLLPKLLEVKNELQRILEESQNGQILKTGIKTIIIGKPNVGKSSILNKLLDEEKAIVTNIEGTTRDIVEGTINLNGVVLNMIDTAGIRKTDDIVEKIGVDKSLSLIEEADLIIVVLNNNEPLTKDDYEILEKTKDKNSIVVINKNDLTSRLEKEELNNRIVIETNTIEETGILSLQEKILELFHLDKLDQQDYTYLSNSRQIALANDALHHLEEAENQMKAGTPIDMVEIDLKQSWDKLGEIIGETYSEELLDQLFSQFCLGK